MLGYCSINRWMDVAKNCLSIFNVIEVQNVQAECLKCDLSQIFTQPHFLYIQWENVNFMSELLVFSVCFYLEAKFILQTKSVKRLNSTKKFPVTNFRSFFFSILLYFLNVIMWDMEILF